MSAPRFGTLLCRYFFYGWMFKDVHHGNVYERAAAWRHNKEQARWLPTYIRRGLTVAALCLAGAWQLSAVFFVPAVLALAYCAGTAVCWGVLCKDRDVRAG